MAALHTDYYVLVTGANCGLGLSIVKRLCTDFLRTHLPAKTLTIIFTTRSSRKSTNTLSQLISHLSVLDGRGEAATLRIRFSTAQVDLTDLPSVIALAKHLKGSFPHLDAAVFNAGMGAFTGINWPMVFRDLAKDWVGAVTHPRFKLQAVGWTKAQTKASEATIGEVFCANVFGHYYLAHELMALLGRGRGRVVWISSLEAYRWAYNVADIEGCAAMHSYESSKRITDVLTLTSALAATSPWSDEFFGAPVGERKVKAYVCHPGICATTMVELPMILWYCMTLAFYIARWIGSPWHTISAHSGALSAVHLVLAGDEELQENKAEKVKWGSGSDRAGKEMLKATEVDGEGGEEWEELGRETWRQLEELRMFWKGMLGNEA